MPRDITSILNEIENTKKASPELKAALDKISKTFNTLIGGLEGSTINYQNLIISTLQSYPLSLGSDSRIRNSFGGLISLEDANKSLYKYLESIKSLDYLKFLREEKKNVVFVGSNGSGKTTLVKHLQTKLNNDEILFFSC